MTKENTLGLGARGEGAAVGGSVISGNWDKQLARVEVAVEKVEDKPRAGVNMVKEEKARLHWVVQTTEFGAIQSIRAGVSLWAGGEWGAVKPLTMEQVSRVGGKYLFEEERDRRGWDKLSRQAVKSKGELPVGEFLSYVVGSERVHSLGELDRALRVERVKPKLRGHYTPNSLVVYGHPALRTKDARVKAKEPRHPTGTVADRENAKRLVYTTLDMKTGELYELTDMQIAAMEAMPALIRIPLEDEEAFLARVRELVPAFDVELPARGSPVESKESVFEVELAPDGSELRVRIFVRVGGEGARMAVGVIPTRVIREVGGEVVEFFRDLEREVMEVRGLIGDVGLPVRGEGEELEWMLEMGEGKLEGVLDVVHKLEGHELVGSVVWPRGHRLKVKKVGVPQLKLTVEKDKKTDWFRVEGGLELDDGVAVDLLALSNLKEPYVKLGTGEYVLLDAFLVERLRELDAVGVVALGGGKEEGGLDVPGMLVHDVEDVLNTAGAFLPVGHENRLGVLKGYEGEVHGVPGGLGATLREYQEVGYRWLESRAKAGMGAVLADDMGLGKTLQAITVLLSYSRRGDKPSLAVVPASLLDNWRKELGSFASELKVRALTSLKGGDLDGLGAGWVVVASYNLVTVHSGAFGGVEWGGVVLDEAQNLKNPTAKRSAAVRELRGEFRIALSGTPVENNLVELWAVFQQVNPSLLGPFATFSARFMTPIEVHRDAGALKVLQRIIRPFLLRRTKAGVLKELPALTEINHEVEPSVQERAVLEALASDARRELRAGAVSGGGSALFATLTHLMRMRRAACDPRLVGSGSGEVGAKVRELGKLMGMLKENGHRALIFSQFTDFLRLIEGYLGEHGFSTLYLDGQTPVKKRGALEEEFQTGDANAFLISLKAGGAGLNITAADYVIIADPWWNPAVEDQATARAHRMGQLKPVTVYRLINMGSVEPKVLLLHERKRELANTLLSTEGVDPGALSKLDAEDLMAALGL